MNLNLNITNKIAIVTGASRGIGKMIAKNLYNQGCKLALISRNKIKLESVKSEISDKSDNIKIYPGDISNFEEVQEISPKSQTAVAESKTGVTLVKVFPPAV